MDSVREGSGIGDRGSGTGGSGTDPVDVLALARQLIDIESTTGNEGEVGVWLASYLRSRGYSVLEQPLDPLTPIPDP